MYGPSVMQICHYRDGRILFADGSADLKGSVESAARDGVDLGGADLRGAFLLGSRLAGAKLAYSRLAGAELTGADLTAADLRRASMRDVILSRTQLTRAQLDEAHLYRANLAGANLEEACLFEADLRNANLTGAILRGALLHGAKLARACMYQADLQGTNLSRAELEPIKEDLQTLLDEARQEALLVLDALRLGKIDGLRASGECASLLGTIARARGLKDSAQLERPTPDPVRPAERWFLAIEPGHTPANHPIAALTAEWIENWQSGRKLN